MIKSVLDRKIQEIHERYVVVMVIADFQSQRSILMRGMEEIIPERIDDLISQIEQLLGKKSPPFDGRSELNRN